MLLQVSGQQFQCMHIWRVYEKLSVPCGSHWEEKGVWSPSYLPGEIQWKLFSLHCLGIHLGLFCLFFCSKTCLHALFTGSQLFRFLFSLLPLELVLPEQCKFVLLWGPLTPSEWFVLISVTSSIILHLPSSTPISFQAVHRHFEPHSIATC